MLNKKICFISSDPSGVYLYRVKQIGEFLNQDYLNMFPFAKLENGYITIREEKILNADIIVLQRHVDPIFLSVIPDLKALGKKVVYDIDDNLWTIPASNLAHNAYGPRVLKTVNQIIGMCDHVTVSTIPLKSYIINKGLNTNVTVIPNMLPNVFEYKEKSNNKTRILFAGSSTHSGDFSFELCKALRQIKREYPVELVFMGHNPIPGSEDEFHPFCKVEEYMDRLNSLNVDIGICPLVDDEFNICKSSIKFLEYSSCGIVTIASNVRPYSDVIDSTVGRLVFKEKDWLFTIESLIKNINNPIKTLSKNAHEYVKKNFTYKYNGQLVIDKWKEIIEDLYK